MATFEFVVKSRSQLIIFENDIGQLTESSNLTANHMDLNIPKRQVSWLTMIIWETI